MTGRGGPGLRGACADLRDLARRHLAAYEAGRATIAPAARTAFLPVALVEPYLAAMDRTSYDPLNTSTDRDPAEPRDGKAGDEAAVGLQGREPVRRHRLYAAVHQDPVEPSVRQGGGQGIGLDHVDPGQISEAGGGVLGQGPVAFEAQHRPRPEAIEEGRDVAGARADLHHPLPLPQPEPGQHRRDGGRGCHGGAAGQRQGDVPPGLLPVRWRGEGLPGHPLHCTQHGGVTMALFAEGEDEGGVADGAAGDRLVLRQTHASNAWAKRVRVGSSVRSRRRGVTEMRLSAMAFRSEPLPGSNRALAKASQK